MELQWQHVVLGMIYLVLITLLYSAVNKTRGKTWRQVWNMLREHFTKARY